VAKPIAISKKDMYRIKIGFDPVVGSDGATEEILTSLPIISCANPVGVKA
jgi:hypothetical protein